MISHSKKFVFVHIIKTAGCSIHTSLKQYSSNIRIHGHSPITRYPINITKEYYKFAFVRNPWDRMYSYYIFCKQNYKPTIPIMKTVSFNEWLLSPKFDFIFLPNEIVFPSKHFCQLNWLMDENKKIKVDFIGRFENLENDFKKITKTLGLHSCNLPHMNKTNHVHYSDIYNNESKEFVAEMSKNDIEYFNYEF